MKKNYMISVEDAQTLVIKSVKAGSIISIPIIEASGYILASDIKSSVNSPPFNQSAMDGYAFAFRDVIKGRDLEIVGESAAGKHHTSKLKRGNAIRIFTGAELPKGADTVVMQEKVLVEENALIIKDPLLKKGSNVRTKGSHVKQRSVALRKGSFLNAAAIGFLASVGITKVEVYAKPVVTVIVTGSELISPGSKLKKVEIYESNSFTLVPAMKKEGIGEFNIVKVKDNFEATRKAFRRAVSTSDLILFTGCISVGDYDYVESVMKDQQVKTIFYKVKQKPGKPIYFGTKENTSIFGLPGNPASALSCFYEFVVPAIRKFQNHKNCFLSEWTLPLSKPVIKKQGLTLFLKAYTDFNQVTPLDGQESYIMKSFAESNCLIVIDEKSTHIKKGIPVKVHYFGD